MSRQRAPGLLLLVLFTLLSACSRDDGIVAVPAAPPAGAGEGAASAPQLPLPPVSFRGELPCADCPGIDTLLSLWPQGGLLYRQQRRGEAQALVRGGRWQYNARNGALTVTLPDGSVVPFQAISADELRLLDAGGRHHESTLPVTLARTDDFTAPPDELVLAGGFVYFADTALFTDCASGIRWPVLMDRIYMALERDYLARQLPAQASLPVRMTARIVQAPTGEGDAPRQVLQLLGFVPAPPCAPP